MKFSNVLLAVASFFVGATDASVLALSGDLDFTPEEQQFMEMFEPLPSATATTTLDEEVPSVFGDDGDIPVRLSVSILNPANYDADFTPEEQQFIEMSLVKAYHKSHRADFVLDLAGAKFNSQTHVPANEVGGSLRGMSGMSYEWDISEFFPMWGCKRHMRRCRGSCRNKKCMEPFISAAELNDKDLGDVAATTKTSPHERWEEKLCKELTGSSFSVFEHVEKCEIKFDDAAATKVTN